MAAPPPPRYNSTYGKKKSDGGNSCLRCICCCCCLLFLIILILSLLVCYFYTTYKPQAPSYQVEHLEVKTLDAQPDLSLKTEVLVTIRAENPNSNIGFVYGEDSSVDVVYSDTDLCSGRLPHFHQGPNNVTVMKVDLIGMNSEFGSGLREAYAASRKNRQIPLLVKVKVPVRVVVGEYPLRELKVFVNCSLLVDSLAPNKRVNIISSNTTFDFKF